MPNRPSSRFAGRTYLVTRRVEGRRFLLRPDDKFNQLFRWLLVLMAKRFDVAVHAAVCMSTHYHLVVSVPHVHVSDFAHDLNMNLADALQNLRRYARGVVWEPGRLSIVELVTEKAIVEKIVYCPGNPVAAGLVHEPHEWPGVITTVEQMGTGTIEAKHPGYYFKGKQWPDPDETVSIDITLPDFLRERGIEGAHAMLQEELDTQLEKAREELKLKGVRVSGAQAARNVSPYKYAKSWKALHTLDPHYAAGRGQTEARVAALRQYKVFLAEYREAKRRWRQGDRDVVFPAGTYWMAVHHGVRVAPPPD